MLLESNKTLPVAGAQSTENGGRTDLACLINLSCYNENVKQLQCHWYANRGKNKHWYKNEIQLKSTFPDNFQEHRKKPTTEATLGYLQRAGKFEFHFLFLPIFFFILYYAERQITEFKGVMPLEPDCDLQGTRRDRARHCAQAARPPARIPSSGVLPSPGASPDLPQGTWKALLTLQLYFNNDVTLLSFKKRNDCGKLLSFSFSYSYKKFT